MNLSPPPPSPLLSLSPHIPRAVFVSPCYIIRFIHTAWGWPRRLLSNSSTVSSLRDIYMRVYTSFSLVDVCARFARSLGRRSSSLLTEKSTVTALFRLSSSWQRVPRCGSAANSPWHTGRGRGRGRRALLKRHYLPVSSSPLFSLRAALGSGRAPPLY